MQFRKIGRLVATALALTLVQPNVCYAENPIVQTIYTSDPAPMVYGDTCYVYTGHDEDGATYYDMRDWRCYSSKDMVNWTDHGTPLSLSSFSWAKSDAWAGQVVERNGKFYYYVPVIAKSGGNSIGVAVSDSPTGPFKDAIGRPLCQGYGYIDPTVYIDSDGQAYLYWGNPDLYYLKLNRDMISYSGSINKVNLTAQGFGGTNNDSSRRTSYQEGPWFYKRGSLYYMLYAAGGIPEHIAYSTSNSPTGPWTYRGVIMPSGGGSFTNHCGVIDFKGNSYFFYHNGALPGGSGFARSVCVEQFQYNSDGTIPTIRMTTKGPDPVAYLDPYVRIEAETICQESGVETEVCNEGGVNVGFIENGDWIKVRNVNFGSGTKSFEARVASQNSGGKIELRLDSVSGTLIGTCNVDGTGDWQNWVTKTCAVSGVTGVHDLYFKFIGGSGYLFNFNWWKFNKISGEVVTPTVTPTATPTATPTVTATPTSIIHPIEDDYVTLNEGYYKIKNVNADKYLHVTDNLGKAGQNVELRTGADVDGQKWYLRNLSDGYITLESALGEFMLDVSYGEDVNGANIGIYDGYSGTAQQFMLKPSSRDGAYIVYTKASNETKVLDGYENRKEDGTNVCQWTYGGNANQQWVFEPVGGQATMDDPITPTPSTKPEVVTPTPTPVAGSGLALDYTIHNWGSGYQISFKVKNESKQKVDTWTLRLKKNEVSIDSSWNVNLKESGEDYVITPVTWNASIESGGSVEFGIQGIGSIGSTINYSFE